MSSILSSVPFPSSLRLLPGPFWRLMGPYLCNALHGVRLLYGLHGYLLLGTFFLGGTGPFTLVKGSGVRGATGLFFLGRVLHRVARDFFLLYFPLRKLLRFFLFVAFTTVVVHSPINYRAMYPNTRTHLFLVGHVGPLRGHGGGFLYRVGHGFPLSNLPMNGHVSFPMVSPSRFVHHFFVLFFLGSTSWLIIYLRTYSPPLSPFARVCRV